MSVESITADARGYAANIVSQAVSAMGAATQAVQQVGFIVPGNVSVTLPAAPSGTLDLTLPEFSPVDLVLPASPGAAPTFQDISNFEAGNAPLLTATPPTIDLPTQPSQLAGFTEAAPSINTSIAFPDPPSELLHPILDAPVLPNRDEPDKPQTLIPSFTATAPTGMPDAPSDLTASFDAAYRNAAPSTITMLNGQVDAFIAKNNPRYFEQMAAIEAQLAKYLQGGTGLNADVENAIYERARSKNSAEARRVRDATYAESAARGFTVPGGAVMSAIQQARQAGADNNATAAREIVVMQAQMEQQNLQFAVTASTGLRQSILSASLNYHQNLIGINGQALDYAKTVLSSIIEMYNAGVRAFGAKLDAYRAEAAVYDTKLKAAMAGIEVYRAEIDALQAMVNVDRAKVEVYQARIGVLNTLANVYRSQIDAVVGRTSLEKLKLEVFQARVQTYATQVQAKNSEWQGYTAAIEGQTAKAKIFSLQVEAYGAQIIGYKATIEGKSAAVQSQALTNKARAEQYSSMLSGYSAVVQATGEVARTKLENQRQTVIAFSAQAQAAVAKAHVSLGYYDSAARVAIKNAELKMTTQIQEAESRRAYGNTIASLSTSNAHTLTGAANAAMSGMNTLAAQTISS